MPLQKILHDAFTKNLTWRFYKKSYMMLLQKILHDTFTKKILHDAFTILQSYMMLFVYKKSYMMLFVYKKSYMMFLQSLHSPSSMHCPTSQEPLEPKCNLHCKWHHETLESQCKEYLWLAFINRVVFLYFKFKIDLRKKTKEKNEERPAGGV